MTTSYFNFQSYNNPHLDEWGLLFTLWLIGNVRNDSKLMVSLKWEGYRSTFC